MTKYRVYHRYPSDTPPVRDVDAIFIITADRVEFTGPFVCFYDLNPLGSQRLAAVFSAHSLIRVDRDDGAEKD